MRPISPGPLMIILASLLCVPVAGHAADGLREIPVTVEKNRFSPDEIRVKAGAPFVLVVTNKDKGPEEFDILVPRIEKVIPAGKTARITFPALKRGTYPFPGEYHRETAKGKIIAE